MRTKNFYKEIINTVLCSILFSWIVTIPNTLVFASPPAPAPKCYVSGVIQNVRFEGEHEAPCVKMNSCPTDTQLSYPDTYYLSIKIQSVSSFKGDTRFRSCDSLYQVGSTQDIFITQDKVKPGDVLSEGQTISGTTISFWGNSFDSYTISEPSTGNANSNSRYGHAQDYSWVSGRLEYSSIEGGCWSIRFSDKQESADNYWGVFGLEFENSGIMNQLKKDDFITLYGHIKGRKFSMACPQNIYSVSSIKEEVTFPETPPIGSQPQSITERLKLLINRIVDSIWNFLRGVKSAETTVRRN